MQEKKENKTKISGRPKKLEGEQEEKGNLQNQGIYTML